MVLALGFGGALNAGAATDLMAYELAPVINVEATVKGKNRKPEETKRDARWRPGQLQDEHARRRIAFDHRGPSRRRRLPDQQVGSSQPDRQIVQHDDRVNPSAVAADGDAQSRWVLLQNQRVT
jgi:hypothetical protein